MNKSYILILIFHFIISSLSVSRQYLEVEEDYEYHDVNSRRFMEKNFDANYYKGSKSHVEAFFPSLENYYTDALLVRENSYPWIARVIHSADKPYPHICTAVCIDRRIFLTAARCIYNLKVNHTRVYNNGNAHSVQAFVIPSKATRQYYDDLGFIVVKPNDYVTWATIQPEDQYERTDKEFQWLEDLRLTDGPMQFRVVGYALKKNIHKFRTPYTEYQLATLDVVVGRNLCAAIFALNLTKSFKVPCYFSCNLHEFAKTKCNKKYLGAEGGGIYNINTNKLFGIATWGASHKSQELPVGFSVPNSDNFYKDLECAKKIRDDTSFITLHGYYQSLCDE